MTEAAARLFAVLAGCLGAIIGSFLNVVIHRLPREEPIGMSRSKCPSCQTLIAWYDNVPVLSYLVLIGRCRSCKQPISIRYPMVEAITAALFVLAFVRAFALAWDPVWLGFAVAASFCATLVAASFIDLSHQILPDKLTKRVLPLIALVGSVGVPSISGTTVFGFDLATGGLKIGLASLLVGVVGGLVGGICVWCIRWAGSKLARREAMGLGDVKLMAACGILLGPGGVLLALLVALVVGSVLGVILWLITRARVIPFGPFLALGVMVVLFFGDETAYLLLERYPAWVRGLF